MNRFELMKVTNDGIFEEYRVLAIPQMPNIRRRDNLGKIIYKQSSKIGGLENNDVIVVASKIVSKSEGRIIDIKQVKKISEKAINLSNKTGKSPEICQVVIDQSNRIRIKNKTIIGYHKLGYILTSAGVDRMDENSVILIPEDPDKSAKNIRQKLESLSKKMLSVVITDSEGREDRAGAGAVALGVSGINPVRKTILSDGREQQETISDMIAGAASLLMGQRGKNQPVVIIRGLDYDRNIESRMQNYLNT